MIRERQARPSKREFGIERDRLLQIFCTAGDIRFGHPFEEKTSLQVKAMGLGIVGTAFHRGRHLRRRLRVRFHVRGLAH